MNTITINYNTGKANGKTYRVPHTYFLGFDLSIMFTGNTEQNVQYDPVSMRYTYTYDVTKAALKTANNGKLYLYFFD